MIFLLLLSSTKLVDILKILSSFTLPALFDMGYRHCIADSFYCRLVGFIPLLIIESLDEGTSFMGFMMFIFTNYK